GPALGTWNSPPGTGRAPVPAWTPTSWPCRSVPSRSRRRSPRNSRPLRTAAPVSIAPIVHIARALVENAPSCSGYIRVMPYWPRARYLELAPRDWARTRARLDPNELALPLGPLTVPPPLPAEQQTPSDCRSRLHRPYRAHRKGTRRERPFVQRLHPRDALLAPRSVPGTRPQGLGAHPCPPGPQRAGLAARSPHGPAAAPRGTADPFGLTLPSPSPLSWTSQGHSSRTPLRAAVTSARTQSIDAGNPKTRWIRPYTSISV